MKASNPLKTSRRGLLLVAMVCSLAGTVTSGVMAQRKLDTVEVERLLSTLSVSRSFAPSSSQLKPKTDATSLEGASLQTVSEQEQFKLRRAKEFADEGDARSAIALWQSVLDSAGSQLVTRDGWNFNTARHEYRKYVTVAHEIESILGELSSDGLDTYRLRADGEARAILANPNGRSRAELLNEVVRRFFISSVGDEAAFELACIKLDRFEFTGASRLLRKCLDEHPDCTVPKSEILLRLAVANGRIGDAAAAERALKELANIARSDQRVDMVRTDVSKGESRESGSTIESNWPLKYGSADRSATMPGVPKSAFSKDLSELWSQDFDVYTTPLAIDPNMAAVYASGGMFSSGSFTYSVPRPSISGKASTKKQKVERSLLVNQWEQSGWAPAGNMLFHEGLLYFKRNNRAMCCSAKTGEMVWMGMENEFSIDPLTLRKTVVGRSMGQKGSKGKPTRPEEIQLFGDRVHQAMSIGDGHFYSIEGPTALDDKAPPTPPQTTPSFYYGISLPPRARRNWLSAYHATNGKLRWRRTARDNEAKGSKFDVGFTCAPVSGGGLTYVATNDAGALWLLALNPKDGKTCLLYTSPSPRDATLSRMPSSA